MTQHEFEDPRFKNSRIEEQFHDFQVTLGAIREIRTSHNIPFNLSIPFATGCDAATANTLSTMASSFGQMANAIQSPWSPNVEVPPLSITRIVQGSRGPISVYVDMTDFIDVSEESSRLQKQRDNVQKQMAAIEGKLSNASFVERAPAEVVQQQRAKLADLQKQLESIASAMAALK